MKERFLAALAAALILTGISAPNAEYNLLYTADNRASDALYQKTGMSDPDIVLFGIDQDTIRELGPVTGLRGAMAQVIDTMNRDPENRPAVIGIDIMYTGESRDAPEADRRLAAAAEKYGNVVTASDARFGNEIVISDNGMFSVSENRVVGLYEPYEALNSVVKTGHINQSLDKDGIFRHARLYIDVPGGERVLSFARVIYEQWCGVNGIVPNDPPQTSEEGYYYLPFSSGGEGYSDGQSFLDLYKGNVDPYFYRGRIVLIGTTATGMPDEYFTSPDHSSKMPGVSIQANIIEAFQKGFFPEEMARSAQLLILFAATFLLTWVLWDRKVLSSVLITLAVVLGWIAVCRAAYEHAAVILHVLWIPFGACVVFIGSVALNYMRTQKEKRRVTDTFGYYIDPVIRDRILAGGADALELGGVTRDIAVLFVDVRGFTSMSEALDAQTVVDIINRYLTLTTDCIMRNHGTLDKFVGDCTMAIWNAPLEQGDPVLLACKAATDMVAGSKALGQELERKYGRSVSFGIGINWGPAVVGNIGAPRRLDYTAIGDTVNTAARLEANAPGGTILISRAVADALGDSADYTSLGNSIPLKGKSEGFEVLRLDGLHAREQ